MTCLAPGSLSNPAAMANDAAVPLAPTIANFSSGRSTACSTSSCSACGLAPSRLAKYSFRLRTMHCSIVSPREVSGSAAAAGARLTLRDGGFSPMSSLLVFA